VTLNRPRLAAWLWLVWAFVVWNLVFDRVIIEAGRDYVRLAVEASQSAGPYAKIEDTMRPARTRALWLASSSAAVILVVGLVALRRATRSKRGT
jgi:hypothetical protein